MRVVIARPEDAARFWPEIERCLAGTLALIKDTHLPTDVLAAVLRGEMFLFVAVAGEAIVGATVCHFTAYPRMRELTVFLVGGSDVHSWDRAMDEAHVAFARAHQCRKLRGGGRKGWGRGVVGALGYVGKGVFFEKDIES